MGGATETVLNLHAYTFGESQHLYVIECFVQKPVALQIHFC